MGVRSLVKTSGSESAEGIFHRNSPGVCFHLKQPGCCLLLKTLMYLLQNPLFTVWYSSIRRGLTTRTTYRRVRCLRVGLALVCKSCVLRSCGDTRARSHSRATAHIATHFSYSLYLERGSAPSTQRS
jgi:hypothetical protein